MTGVCVCSASHLANTNQDSPWHARYPRRTPPSLPLSATLRVSFGFLTGNGANPRQATVSNRIAVRMGTSRQRRWILPSACLNPGAIAATPRSLLSHRRVVRLLDLAAQQPAALAGQPQV